MLALLAGAILGPDWSAPITTPPPGSTTLHFLPNHQCTGEGEYTGADGKFPYCSKDEARAACVAAGCARTFTLACITPVGLGESA